MELLIDNIKHGVSLLIFMVFVITLPGLLTGLVVSIFQAVTQIHEISLTFVPKIIVTIVSILVFSSLYGPMITDYTQTLFKRVPQLASSE